jgi:hypothetical protein
MNSSRLSANGSVPDTISGERGRVTHPVPLKRSLVKDGTLLTASVSQPSFYSSFDA